MRRWSPERRRQARLLGLRIRLLRRLAGLAQHELAARAGTTQKRVSALELGESDLSLDEVAAYLRMDPGRCRPARQE